MEFGWRGWEEWLAHSYRQCLHRLGQPKLCWAGKRQSLVEITPKVIHREKIICRIFKSRFSDKAIDCGWLLMQNVNKTKLSFLTKKKPKPKQTNKQNPSKQKSKLDTGGVKNGTDK